MMTTIALVLTFSIASFALSAWFFLKKDGIVDGFASLKRDELEAVRSSLLSLAHTLGEMEVKVGTAMNTIKETEAMAHRRLTALETRNGRADKKREREEAIAKIFADPNKVINENEVEHVA